VAERKAELLEVPYFPIVFTLLAEIGAIAYQNKAVIYDLLFNASSDTTLTIAADPKHLGAKIGVTAVQHLGLGDDPSSPCAHDRHGWRDLPPRMDRSPHDPTISCHLKFSQSLNRKFAR
jgi:hypothetical protein